jgi:hypothetical protein
VSGGLNRLLASAFVAAAFAAGAALIAAPAALACSGGPSAYNVYKECLSNGGSGGGGKNKGGGGSGSSRPSSSGGSQSSSSTTTPPPAPPAKVPKKAKKAIADAGKDGDALKRLYRAGGGTRFLSASHAATPASEPTAIGSTFDIGSGPTALLIALAGTAVILLAMTGVRGVRRRR